MKAVIWDLDGILADSTEAHFRSWVTALAEWEIPLDRPTFNQTSVMNNRDALTYLLGRTPEPVELGTIVSRKEHFFRLLFKMTPIAMPGASLLLEALSRENWLQALASSAPMANINLIIDQLQIRSWFSAILSSENIPNGKPDPSLFLQAAQIIGVSPDRCIVVEDSPAGAQAACRAGMKCIALATTRPRPVLESADLIFDDLNQLTTGTFSRLLESSRIV